MAELIHLDTILRSSRALIKNAITLPQALILLTCSTRNPSMTELSKILVCSTTAITGQMDALEKRNLIERTRHDDDRRTIFAHITDRGREVVANINATFETL